MSLLQEVPEFSQSKQMPLNLSRYLDRSTEKTISGIVPISIEAATQGLNAIGGCRQCARTFCDRLELIHHFVDHFPSIFYSFELQRKVEKPTLGMFFGSKIFLSILASTPIFRKKSQENMPSSPLRATKTPPSLPVSVEREPQSATATATATPIMNHSFLSPLPTPIAEMKSKNNQPNLSKPFDETPSVSNEEKKKKRTFVPMPLLKTGRVANDLPYHMCPYCCQTFLDAITYEDHVNAHKMVSKVFLQT